MQDAVERPVDCDELGDVVLDEARTAGCRFQVGDVVARPGDEVVHPHDLVALGQEPVGEMRAEEAGGAGDQDSHGRAPSDAVMLEAQRPHALGIEQVASRR